MTPKPSHISLHRIWLIVLIVLLDQSTKHLVVSSLEPNRPTAILPAVDFVLSYNKGISFSFLQFVNDAQRWPLVGLSILASGISFWRQFPVAIRISFWQFCRGSHNPHKESSDVRSDPTSCLCCTW